MKFLSPDIAKLAKSHSNKSLARPGVSCGIFQDCHDTELKYSNEYIADKHKKDGK